MTVGVPAKVSLSIPTMKVIQGEEMDVRCLVSKAGNPPPSISLSLNKSSDLAQLGGGDRALVSYYPTEEETGSVFICKWEQVGPMGTILYQGEEVSAPLYVMIAPSIVEDTPGEYLYQEGMEVVMEFLAKPAPAKENVQWEMMTETKEKMVLEDLAVVEVGEVETVADEEHKFKTSISVHNLTENITMEITVKNEAGLVKKTILIFLPPPASPDILPSPTMEQFQASSSSSLDMSQGYIIALISLIIFTILLIFITIMLVRFRRREEENKDITSTGWLPLTNEKKINTFL